VQPNIIGTMLDMSAVSSGSVDAIFSSHNIERLHPHEVPLALAEFRRVLAPSGFGMVAGIQRPQAFDLWAVTSLENVSETKIRALAGEHFPMV